MNTVKKIDNKNLIEKKILLKTVERSAQIEELSLRSARSNFKVIATLQKYGRAFSL